MSQTVRIVPTRTKLLLVVCVALVICGLGVLWWPADGPESGGGDPAVHAPDASKPRTSERPAPRVPTHVPIEVVDVTSTWSELPTGVAQQPSAAPAQGVAAAADARQQIPGIPSPSKILTPEQIESGRW